MMRWLVLLALLGGCSLQDPGVDALGGSDRSNGPLHRAGQPCLRCHSFAIAGTVYDHASDPTGLPGATVTITDAQNRSFTATSNEVGNFWVTVGGGGRGREGQTVIAFDPAFPLRVKVSAGGLEQPMRTAVGRDGSCSECHTVAAAGSVARVFVHPEGP